MMTQEYTTYPTHTEDDGLRPRTDTEALPFTETGEPDPYLDPADEYMLGRATRLLHAAGPECLEGLRQGWRHGQEGRRQGVPGQPDRSPVDDHAKIIHLEMGLQREMTTAALTYPMTSLYGER